MLLLKLRCGILLRGGGGVGGISAGAAVLLQAPPLAKVGDEDEDEQQQYEEEKEADDHSEAFVQLRVIGVVPWWKDGEREKEKKAKKCISHQLSCNRSKQN